MAPYLFNDRRSPLAQAANVLLQPLVAQLQSAEPKWERWKCFRIVDPDSENRFSYFRIAPDEQFRLPVDGEYRTLAPAFHFFDKTEVTGAYHNHVFPLHVLPLRLPVAGQTPGPRVLYSMDWQYKKRGWLFKSCISGGCEKIIAKSPYTIYDCKNFYHRVHSHTPHGSFVVTDITDGPIRKPRTRIEPITIDLDIKLLKAYIRALLDGIDAEAIYGPAQPSGPRSPRWHLLEVTRAD